MNTDIGGRVFAGAIWASRSLLSPSEPTGPSTGANSTTNKENQ